ncbi:extracellular matrix protein 1-like [Periophthalmus magnuspinnatus]|uniref:extracellular matrix protein 1-like n=1 Tax=Periophthalmus magnuspinnatus TaxID=409849 RepID=UPI00145BAC11|nr:extracellular matrix protein 1-like [Periophthalmus magnuspinnatus]
MTAALWALVCSGALLLFHLEPASSAVNVPDSHIMQRPVDVSELFDDLEDDSLWQRETTFIPQQVMQEAIPDSHFLQREMDMSEILSEFKLQPGPAFSPRASRPRGFAPVEPIEKYHVVFPLARPTSQNIRSICLHGNRRPRYPESYFPSSGFGVSKREGDAVNTLEAWFGTCCGQDQTEEKLLCCATQAWEKSINHFCEVGFRIKTTHFHCCKRNSSERLPCFDREAPNPDYNPTEESAVEPVAPDVEFNFDPTSCPTTSMTPHSIRDGRREKKGKKPAMPIELDLDFPLAAPTDSNIESICRNRKLRPHYNIKCLKGLDLAALQAKSINSLEKYFKICCRNKERILSCAQTSWKEGMKKFCVASTQKRIDFPCCEGGVQFECFKNISTDPDYSKINTEEPSLSKICDTHKIITKKYPVGFPLKSVVNKCCHLLPTERSACLPQAVLELFQATCSSKKSPPSVKRCCRLSSAECFNKVLMDAITKATSRPRKKICPVSQNL